MTDKVESTPSCMEKTLKTLLEQVNGYSSTGKQDILICENESADS